MQGSRPSKLSKDLGHIREQLKSGKTRGKHPRDLEPKEIEDLEKARDGIIKQMHENRAARLTVRINSHTTSEADRVITAVKDATKDSEHFFQAVGGAGSSTDLRAQARVLQARATEQARQERANERAKIKAEREKRTRLLFQGNEDQNRP